MIKWICMTCVDQPIDTVKSNITPVHWGEKQIIIHNGLEHNGHIHARISVFLTRECVFLEPAKASKYFTGIWNKLLTDGNHFWDYCFKNLFHNIQHSTVSHQYRYWHVTLNSVFTNWPIKHRHTVQLSNNDINFTVMSDKQYCIPHQIIPSVYFPHNFYLE